MRSEGGVISHVFDRRLRWVSLSVVVLILIVSSLQCAAPEYRSPAEGSTASDYAMESSFGPASLEPLPTVDFHLRFKNSGVGTTWIDAPITMNVIEDYNTSTGALLGYMSGYTFDSIIASNPPLALSLRGIGIDYYFCYWYSYNSSGKIYDE